MFYWIGIIVLLAAFILGFSFLGPAGALLNPGSLFIICAVVLPLLIASGQFQYFLMGIRIAVGRVKKAPAEEVKKVLVALQLTTRLTLLGGFIGFLAGGISILANMTTVQMLGRLSAVAVVSILYALLGVSFLLPLRAKAEAFLIDMTRAPGSAADE
ncbi:hypothetical protein SAMN02745823_01902 [Sporobacter termitidis DSM 10068]|uniref:MotA/TolQ/ExbB proton channel family protein n=1 Tax=Sporobacter termitidis DSM 10068 TaxID=1123282 RepID=A0A1M5XP99_9FIRM|nr:hypothetical protein [Sporobacter termitidis]SHI01374.1 hypothetical protein SAMN02745823_01902 [Sporobacter termitidis DSM 10068]